MWRQFKQWLLKDQDPPMVDSRSDRHSSLLLDAVVALGDIRERNYPLRALV